MGEMTSCGDSKIYMTFAVVSARLRTFECIQGDLLIVLDKSHWFTFPILIQKPQNPISANILNNLTEGKQ